MEADQHRGWSSSARVDVSALFVIAIAVGPFFLPVIGIEPSDVVFVVPFACLCFAMAQARAAARRAPDRRILWWQFAVATGVAAAASAAAVISGIGGVSLTGAYYLGLAASVALLLAAFQLFRQGSSALRPDQLCDALLLGGLVVALGVYFVVAPGFSSGDVLLTVVFLIDLGALVLTAATAIGGERRRIAALLTGGVLAIVVGDGVVAAAAAGKVPANDLVTAFMWTLGALAFAMAAGWERGGDRAPASDDIRWPYIRALFPLPIVLAFAALGILEVTLHGVRIGPIAYFGTFFLLALVVGFARQAYLVVANRRAAARERRIRADATRRNEELQAVTGLAATMTESFEEETIVERGLEVLRLGARATSAALHVGRKGALELLAITGRWRDEGVWAATPGDLERAQLLEERGQRQIVRLPLVRRERAIGLVTVIRSAKDPFDKDDLVFLRLLVGQLTVALQNARDYRERLDQAIRDPLTGLYNRRFFYEALAKEVERHRRYGSPVSLVLFDIDDFKRINDLRGHGVGDEVLCRIGDMVEDLIRPVDSFARLGGEEFGLLLPETGQLDALLVAERVRSRIARTELVPGQTVRVSAGISSCPEDGTTVQVLEKKADDAMYWAKRNGKNLCAVAGEVVVTETPREEQHVVAHLHALIGVIDSRLRTSHHSDNVAGYAAALGKALGLDAQRVIRLRRAALLHDLGKIAVSTDILGKPDALDAEERAEVQRHPITGAMILRQAGLDEEARWIRHHHERVDGSGYPDGLVGNEIPLESRILFVADAFEAMTSDRPYRVGMTVGEALDEMRSCAGTQFDARVVEALVSVIDTGDLQVAPLRTA